MARRLLPILAWSALAVLGLALGAETQRETHLAPEQIQDLGDRPSAASGNIVVFTGLLVAAGVTGALAALAPPTRRSRTALALLALGVFVATNIVQTAWPNLTAVVTDDLRAGRLTINLLVFNLDGLPGVFVPVLALLAGALLAAGWAVHHLLVPPAGRLETASQLLVRQCGAAALAVPFLAVAAWSLVRLLLEPGVAHGLAVAVLSLGALACTGLVATCVWKALHLAAVARDPRLAPVAREAWVGLGRAEQILAGALALTALLGGLLRPTAIDALHPGVTFGVTLRSHALFLATILVPVLPLLLLQPRVVGDLARRPLPGQAPWPAISSLCAGTAICVAGTGLATFGAKGALWAWVVATAAMALAAVPVARSRHALATILLAGFTLWAAGNTNSAIFEAVRGTNLAYDETPPGALALLRIAGALVAGLGIAAAARSLTQAPLRPSVATPLATAVAIAVVGIAMLELPLDIWVETDYRGESAAMGSLVASQVGAVRTLMHAASLALACALAWSMARMLRPEWFGRPPAPRPALRATVIAGPGSTPSG